MRRDTINYLTVGVFVLVLFVLLMGMLYQITGRTGPTDDYFVKYGNVDGIKYGTPVLYEGYQIGQVEEVVPVREGGGTQFELTLAVKEGWQIPDDSIAKVSKSGLLSAVAIDIQEGQSGTPMAPGGELRGQESFDIFSAVGDVAADFKSLSRESIRPLLDNLNKQVDGLAADLRSITQGSLKPILDKQVTPLLDKLDDSAEGLRNVLSDENQEHVDTILANLTASSSDVQTLIAEIGETRKSLDKLLADTDRLVASNEEDIREVVMDLKKSLYAVSQHIDAVAHNLEGSSRNMQEFTRQIRENPGLLLRGSSPPDEGASP
ncbi:MAG: MCE family protein [Gammaproteobacteria bacterium]|nr:MCE family protein [Gammaproteobacteria bacterium]